MFLFGLYILIQSELIPLVLIGQFFIYLFGKKKYILNNSLLFATKEHLQ